MTRADGIDRDSPCQPSLIDARNLVDGNQGAEFERAETSGARHFGYHPKAHLLKAACQVCRNPLAAWDGGRVYEFLVARCARRSRGHSYNTNYYNTN